MLGSGASRQRRRVEDSCTSTAAADVADTDRDRHRASLGVGDALRHSEDATVDDDHDDERQVERADRSVELVANRLTQFTLTLDAVRHVNTCQCTRILTH